jgi:hypothetical protein
MNDPPPVRLFGLIEDLFSSLTPAYRWLAPTSIAKATMRPPAPSPPAAACRQ